MPVFTLDAWDTSLNNAKILALVGLILAVSQASLPLLQEQVGKAGLAASILLTKVVLHPKP